jgi:predicted homoserine dehydrogenase-like protein
MPNLHTLLAKRAASPIRVGLIGGGKFGSMFLAQARRTPGIHIVGVADREPGNARSALALVGWPEEQFAAASLEEAASSASFSTCVTDDASKLIQLPALDVLIDATGSPAAGIKHATSAIEHGKHLVMVNVETDALVGPLLAQKAQQAGLVYSLAYGDQPALIAEMCDWARAAGFEVVAAGKGTKYLPEFHASTPETIWQYYGITPEDAAKGRLNPQMFNSFLDGTKSGIEMAATANATGLLPPSDGLLFPPSSVDDLASVLRPVADGGVLERRGMVEVVSSLERDGTPVGRDLRWGVFTTFAAGDEYVRRCFAEYGLQTDESGWYASQYKPYHLIGLELGISVASAALRGEPTGCPSGWRADVVAVAKRDLAAGEVLDGEGGFTVWGKCVPASTSVAHGALPLGLAHGCRLTAKVSQGDTLRWEDVDFAGAGMEESLSVRREMELACPPLY